MYSKFLVLAINKLPQYLKNLVNKQNIDVLIKDRATLSSKKQDWNVIQSKTARKIYQKYSMYKACTKHIPTRNIMYQQVPKRTNMYQNITKCTKT